MKPKRIQRRRTKGWKMPPNTVYVGRPTKWGNPFCEIDDYGRPCAKKSAEEFKAWLESPYSDERAFDINHLSKTELRGKNLACWCPLDKPCHADVLLEIANCD